MLYLEIQVMLQLTYENQGLPVGHEYKERTNDTLFIPVNSHCDFFANPLNGNILQRKVFLKLFPVIFQSHSTINHWSSRHPVKNAQYSKVLPTFFVIDQTLALNHSISFPQHCEKIRTSVFCYHLDHRSSPKMCSGRQ